MNSAGRARLDLHLDATLASTAWEIEAFAHEVRTALGGTSDAAHLVMAMRRDVQTRPVWVRERSALGGGEASTRELLVSCSARGETVPLAACERCPHLVASPQGPGAGEVVTCRPPTWRINPPDGSAASRSGATEAAASARVGEVPAPRPAFAGLDSAPLAQRIRAALSSARRRLSSASDLLSPGGIVARRYVGTLGGAEGGEPLELLFVGRKSFEREFEVYFRATAERRLQPVATTFRGNLAQCAMHGRELTRQAASADLVAWEAFPGAAAGGQDTMHYPMLDGRLRVARTVEEQIRRVRSRAQRHLMRDLLETTRYRSWVASDPAAFEAFCTTLHEPYIRGRFGAWASTGDDQQLRRLYARRGCILFLAERGRPTEPVCGTLLLDNGGGALAYQVNGFAGEGQSSANVHAERTAALELALVQHAIDHGFTRINLGYTRAILNDGLFVHKSRLGCTFVPVPGSPLFRLRVRPTRRAAIFGRYPLLAGAPGSWTALLGYDAAAAPRSKRAWHAALKDLRVPGLAKAVVWTRAKTCGAMESRDERLFREAIAETLDLPGGVEFRPDE